MATYRAIVIVKTDEEVEAELIEEYLTDVLTTMPFDDGGSLVVQVVKEQI